MIDRHLHARSLVTSRPQLFAKTRTFSASRQSIKSDCASCQTLTGSRHLLNRCIKMSPKDLRKHARVTWFL